MNERISSKTKIHANMDVPQIIFSSEKKKPLKSGSSEYFSANDFSLTEKEIEKARIEFSESEERKKLKLQELRDNLASYPGVNYRNDDEYLLRFLRVRKYDCTRAYQNIKEGYIFKKRHYEFWQISEDLKEALNRNIFRYLPYTDEQGHIIVQIDFENWKCQEIAAEEVFKMLIATSGIITMNPRMQVNGVIAIWDTKGVTAQKISTILSYFGLREIAFAIHHMFPWRVKKVLVINTGRLSRLFYSMFRPFLSKKMAERVILLGTDVEELHQHINPVLLPKGLGGFLEETQCCITQDIIDNIPYIKYDNSFILDENN